MNTIPLTLGITGHRDPRTEDLEILRSKVRKVFKLLQNHCPNTPLQLLSPLADGADRLVAKVALEENIQLIVPLPMKQSIYEQDFDVQSKKEFKELLNQANKIFTLPLVEGNTETNIVECNDNRTQQYALVGAFIARHSHILLALWDGIPLDKMAGTAQVVKFKLTGYMKGLSKEYLPPKAALDTADMGPVCQIMTARSTKSEYTVGDIKILLPNNKNSSELETLLIPELTSLDQFNLDVQKYTNKSQSSQKHLLPPKLREALPDLAPGFQNLLGVFGSANDLAKYFQIKVKYFSFTVLTMTFLMIIFYGWYSSINHEQPLALGIYALLFIVSACLVGFVKWQRYHTKVLDYRTLAEGLRVQIFWHLSGLNHSVSDYYLRNQRQELGWIRDGIRALNFYDWLEYQQTLDVVHNRWIMYEKDWFTKITIQKKLLVHNLNLIIAGLFSVGIILMVIMWVDHVFGEFLWNYSILQTHPFWHNIFILLIALFPATGALLHHYLEKMAFEEEVKQYQRMAILFTTAHNKLEQVSSNYTPEQILFEVGTEVLKEDGEWILMHRKSPMKISI
ncbi:MAG TPA: hypothetical protein ENK59_08655 [Thioploca sp.]|nr:hypothetical protein [Thioploca sp.]